MPKYNPSKIEKKWQRYWQAHKTFQAKDFSQRKKAYVLVEFPYPSGAGLHMGHLRPYVAGDTYSRFLRLNNREVMFPIGWDAFGLPAENFAIKNGVHPSVSTARNIKNAKKQIQSWGLSFDWSREINTTDPNYYKWTQWIFLQFYKAGLAYEATGLINWCPKDKTGLANEEVIDGKCERCGSVVEKKELRQWYLKITAYAEKLLEGLKHLPNWPEAVKLQQANWIGKSIGAEIEFEIRGKWEVGSGKKPNFVLLHGYNGSPKKNFFPWLKSVLESKGYRVQAPSLPHASNPVIAEQVSFVLQNCHFDENTIVLGHSLGGVVAMKVLEKLDKPVRKLVLAASFFENRFKDHDRFDSHTHDWVFDFKKIKSMAGETLYLRDASDPVIFEDQADKLNGLLGSRTLDFTAQDGHICGKQEPFVLEALIPSIKIFTTRPDTIFGATYMVVAPEHEIIQNSKFKIENWDEVKEYIEQAKKKSELDRSAEGKEKTGVELKGIKAINPATNEEIPVWVADYVLGGYGTGAIMAVPAHDQRDFEFAKTYNLPIKEVIAEETGTARSNEERRDGGCGIIFDPVAQKYAAAKSADGLIRLFAGGVENGEDLQQGVLREISEESGLHDFAHVEKIAAHYTHFHNARKNVNRVALATCFLVVLKSNHQQERKLEAHEQDLNLAWLSPEEILENWQAHNQEGDVEHWIRFLRKAVARAVELGLDTTSDPKKFTDGAAVDSGIVVSSGKFTGMKSEDAILKMAEAFGKISVQYKLRDWVFSRQRYWGEPIPIIHCEKCGIVPVPEKDLPVKLPPVKKYEPTGTGESPLAAISEWVNVKCPKCKGPAKRETNTMPQWAGSSWYYLRYTDPKDKKIFADYKKQKYWLPIDVYFGGMEHTTLHLLYSRFWNLFLYDQKLVPVAEPYSKRQPHGIVLGPDGEKMSKSRGNVVNPDDVVKKFGADTLRMYEMFLGPHEATVSWNDQGILGVRRFLERVWNWVNGKIQNPKAKGQKDSEKTERALHKLIKKITEDVQVFHFNTAISSFMEFHNEIKDEPISVKSLQIFLVLLYPFAPHISEELNQILGNKKSLQLAAWPKFNPKKTVEAEVEIVVQVNGKVKGRIMVPQGADQNAVQALAENLEVVRNAIAGQPIKKIIYVPNRIINMVV